MTSSPGHDLSFSIDHGDGTMNHRSHDGTMSMGQIPTPPSGGGKPTTSASGTLQFVQDQLKQSSHPLVIIFHILFKAVSLFVYIFGGWFVGGSGAEKGARFISLTVVCILLLAADFWVVKNVTGRLLVGLRWWNQVEDEGTKWIFESAEGKRPVNAFDRNVFWAVLYGTPAIWSVLFIVGLLNLKLNWLMIVIMALTLSCANVYGYYKCSSEQKTRTQQMMQQYAQQGAIAVMRSNMLSMLTGSIASAATGTTMSPNNTNNGNPNFV
jgi:Eukaryotic protein of unknown function (DUF846)